MNPFSLEEKFQCSHDKQIVQFIWEKKVLKKFYKFIGLELGTYKGGINSHCLPDKLENFNELQGIL